MEKETLNALKELHKQLGQAESLNEADRRLVEQLQQDLNALLAHSGKGPPPEYESIIERLRDATRRFEASHPDLTVTMAALTNTLSNLGI